MVDQLFPKVGMAMAEVLERLGYRWIFPRRRPAADSPRSTAAIAMKPARWPAISSIPSSEPSTSWSRPDRARSMVSHHFAELFHERCGHAGAGACACAARLGVLRVPHEVAGVEDVGARFEDMVTYHDGCHALRELNVRTRPRRLLAHVRGLELREMHAGRRVLRLRRHVRGEVRRAFRRHGAHQDRGHPANRRRRRWSRLDPSCLMQIQGALSRAGAPIGTMHLAEVLASR